MTVGELLARISSRELTEWAIYERMTGPLGGARADVHAAMITHAVVNTQRGKRAPIPLKRFVPQWERRKLSPEELYQRVREINAALGGRAPTHPAADPSAAAPG